MFSKRTSFTVIKTASIAALCVVASACSQFDSYSGPSASLSRGDARNYAKNRAKIYSTDGGHAALNAYRRQNGLGPVSPDPVLRTAAVRQARLMAQNQKMSHATSWGNGFTARVHEIGVNAAAENVSVGYQSAPGTMAGWMRSSGHRRNMLGTNYSRYGFAVAKDRRGRPYWALILAK